TNTPEQQCYLQAKCYIEFYVVV
nr:RecName: Full=Zinc metalloproteinase oxiagin; AltName: Full=Snake venom metalloprotease; Short=SVMP [Naja oxiana]